MATPDLSVFDRIRTKADYDREAEEFELKRLALTQAKAGNLPAALQIADRIKNLRAQKAAGNTNADQEISDIMDVQKVYKYEPGVYNQGGYVQAMPGYADAISGIEGAKSGSKQQAQKDVDLVMNPRIKAEETSAGIEAETTTTARTNLPKAEAHAQQIQKMLEDIENSPGLSASVGMPNPMKGRIPWIGDVAGSPAADFTAKLEQLKGNQFLEAFESLKGGGAITEVEGTKAEQAKARMQTSQSEAEFKRALNDFKVIVAGALDRERAKAAGGNFQTPAAPPALDPRKIPMDAVRELKADPSGAAEFDAVFGEGAARMVLGGQ